MILFRTTYPCLDYLCALRIACYVLLTIRLTQNLKVVALRIRIAMGLGLGSEGQRAGVGLGPLQLRAGGRTLRIVVVAPVGALCSSLTPLPAERRPNGGAYKV